MALSIVLFIIVIYAQHKAGILLQRDWSLLGQYRPNTLGYCISAQARAYRGLWQVSIW